MLTKSPATTKIDSEGSMVIIPDGVWMYVATLRVEIVDYGPGAGSTLVKGMKKPATRFAQSAVAVPTNGNSSSPWVRSAKMSNCVNTCNTMPMTQAYQGTWYGDWWLLNIDSTNADPCGIVQEMVVVAGVHPEVDLSDIAIWRPQFSQ